MGNLGHKELDQLSFPSVEFLSAVISAAKQHFKKILEEQNSSFSASRNLLISRVNSPLSLCWSMFAGKRVYSSTVTINWEWTPLGHYAVSMWQVYKLASSFTLTIKWKCIYFGQQRRAYIVTTVNVMITKRWCLLTVNQSFYFSTMSVICRTSCVLRTLYLW